MTEKGGSMSRRRRIPALALAKKVARYQYRTSKQNNRDHLAMGHR